jgi:hypothetical protein
VETNRSPIIRANQAHRIGCCDCEAASIAGVSGAGVMPQINRAVSRKAAIFDALSNALLSCIRNHTQTRSNYRASDQSALRYGNIDVLRIDEGPLSRGQAMMRLARRASVFVVFLLLTSAATAHAECVWVMCLTRWTRAQESSILSNSHALRVRMSHRGSRDRRRAKA